jgi:hypothetical protein
MSERLEDVHDLRSLAARLRSLAMAEPHIAERLLQMAKEAEERARLVEDGRQEP